MENFRTIAVRVFMALVIVASTFYVCDIRAATRVYAWSNVQAHSRINELAYDSFVGKWMTGDQYLKQATLDGGTSKGESWEPADGTSWTTRIEPKIRQKTIEDWLSEGGFSADEPELSMSLMHFYDPVNNPHYLTDYIETKLPDYLGKDSNPQISAYQWAFESYDNPFSFINGEQNFLSALRNKDSNDVNYGKAWRAVGETMHLISDMTVPAHVRNDAHIPFGGLWDPMEYFTNGGDIDTYGPNIMGGSATPALGDYHTAYTTGKDIRTLFKDVATWTNANFFSRDTVPLYQSNKTPNGFDQYPNPKVTIDPNFKGYYTTTVDGDSQFPLARQAITGIIFGSPYLVVDQKVCGAQRAVLIPTAIKASAAVMDAFLPRFQVVIDNIEPDSTGNGMYVVTAHIKHIATREWPQDITIGNGAHIKVDSIDTEVTVANNLDNKDNLNSIKYKVSAKEGSKITVFYDFGGYKINSTESQVASNLRINPASLNGEPGKNYIFNAVIDNIPSGVRFNWLIDGTSKLNTTDSSFATSFASEGNYTIKVSMLDSNGKEMKTAQAAVKIQKPASLSTTPANLAFTLQDFQKMTHLGGSADAQVTFKESSYQGTTSERTSQQGFVFMFPSAHQGAQSNLKITWNGTSFSGISVDTVESDVTHIVSGMVSPDGQTLVTLSYQFHYKITTPNSAGYTEDMVQTLTLHNIPLAKITSDFGPGIGYWSSTGSGTAEGNWRDTWYYKDKIFSDKNLVSIDKLTGCHFAFLP
jgi:hypothetical protein